MIDDGCRMVRFYPERVLYVRANGNYSDVYAHKNEKTKPIYTLSYKIGKLYEKLFDMGYVRINRSEFINRIHVSEIWGNEITMIDGTKLYMTTSFREDVIAQFELLTAKRENLE